MSLRDHFVYGYPLSVIGYRLSVIRLLITVH